MRLQSAVEAQTMHGEHRCDTTPDYKSIQADLFPQQASAILTSLSILQDTNVQAPQKNGKEIQLQDKRHYI
jgi:hypothetical protein